MKIIFLDIDGVLVLENSGVPHEEYAHRFDKECVKTLNEILSETNAEIVLTSDWKKIYDIERLNFIFKWNGVAKSPIDVTKDFRNRETEITDYVQRKNVSDFVILDDMNLVIFPKNFVRCNTDEGLKQKDIKEKITLILTLAVEKAAIEMGNYIKKNYPEG